MQVITENYSIISIIYHKQAKSYRLIAIRRQQHNVPRG
jgi:hypothetical protein